MAIGTDHLSGTAAYVLAAGFLLAALLFFFGPRRKRNGGPFFGLSCLAFALYAVVEPGGDEWWRAGPLLLAVGLFAAGLTRLRR